MIHFFPILKNFTLQQQLTKIIPRKVKDFEKVNPNFLELLFLTLLNDISSCEQRQDGDFKTREKNL
jgi:hypothetical protein